MGLDVTGLRVARYRIKNMSKLHVDIPDFNGLSPLLKAFAWQWFVHFTFPVDGFFGLKRAKRSLLWWTRKLCVTERIQVGYCYCIAASGDFTHIHALMLGLGRSTGVGKTLADVSKSYWRDRWPHFAKIEVPRSIPSVSGYVADHEYDPEYECELDFYNIKLLKKHRLTPTPLDI